MGRCVQCNCTCVWSTNIELMDDDEHQSKPSACFQGYNRTLCPRVVMSLLCTMQHGGLQNQNLTTSCAFSHKKSHFECHKTHTLSLRRLWKGGDLGGEAPIGRPLLLRKPRGGFPHLAHGIKIRALTRRGGLQPKALESVAAVQSPTVSCSVLLCA